MDKITGKILLEIDADLRASRLRLAKMVTESRTHDQGCRVVAAGGCNCGAWETLGGLHAEAARIVREEGMEALAQARAEGREAGRADLLMLANWLLEFDGHALTCASNERPVLCSCGFTAREAETRRIVEGG